MEKKYQRLKSRLNKLLVSIRSKNIHRTSETIDQKFKEGEKITQQTNTEQIKKKPSSVQKKREDININPFHEASQMAETINAKHHNWQRQ